MKCPFASWKPVGNHGGAMTSHTGLVVHVQQGNGSLEGYFNNPAVGASSHFWVSKAGYLEQYVDTDLVAWAQVNGNANYLSVETEGYDSEPLSTQQLTTLTKLVNWCVQNFKFPSKLVNHGDPGVTTHAFYPSGIPDPAWGGHPCPGSIRTAQLPSIVSVPTPPPPPPPPLIKENEMVVIEFPSDSANNIKGGIYLVTGGVKFYFGNITSANNMIAALKQSGPCQVDSAFGNSIPNG